MRLSKVIYLSLFMILCAVLAGVSYEQMVNARPYRNNKGKSAGKGILYGGLGGAAIGGIAGGPQGAGIGLGLVVGVGALAGAASSRDDYYHLDEYDYDNDDCDNCD